MPGMAIVSRTRRPRDRLAAVVLVGVVLTGCADSQDPGLVDTPGNEPNPTSDTLGRCPDGGPDATTAPAGCIGADGRVQRP